MQEIQIPDCARQLSEGPVAPAAVTTTAFMQAAARR